MILATGTETVKPYNRSDILQQSQFYSFQRSEEISGYLVNLNIDKFMREITGSFKRMCKRLWGADKIAYLHLFNGLIGVAKHKVTVAYPYTTNLWVNAEKATILLEFQANGTALEAFEQFEKYRKNFYNAGKDILCVGINYQFMEIEGELWNDKIVCNWIAGLYYENGTLKKYFPLQEETLLCP